MHLPILSFTRLRSLNGQDQDSVLANGVTEHQPVTSTAWADGIRGLATFGVVASHLSLCFARSLLPPCCSTDGSRPSLFQLPIFRLVASGHSWVAVFFLLLGFVNSLKPLKLAQSGQHDDALVNLSKSSLRRIFRLVLPATLTTLIAWLSCQFRLMERARSSNAWWLYKNTPNPSSSFIWALKDFLTAIKFTWLYHQGDNIYNQPQWTMMPLLQGSLMVLLAVLFTVNLTFGWRVIVLCVAALWSINLSGELCEPLVGLTTLTGIVLADFSIHPNLPTLIHKKSTQYIAILLIVLGLALMSYPSTFPENAAWSRTLHVIGQKIFPYPNRIEIHRIFGSIGAILFVLGVISSPVARTILSTKPLTYLGKISFPVFLLHPLFMQIIMPWLAFSSTREEYPSDPPARDELGRELMVLRHPQRGAAMVWIAIIVSMSCCLIAAHYWMLHMEPIFGRITARSEAIMTGKLAMDNNGSRVGRSLLPLINGITDAKACEKE